MNLSKNAKKLLLNMSMGDGCIDTHGHFSSTHSLKQKEYLEWKYELLKKEDVPLSFIKYINNRGYGAYSFRTKKIYWLISQRKYLYNNGKKSIAQKGIINVLDELGLAIWYMDDGCSSYKRNQDGKIHGFTTSISTYVSKKENQYLIDFIKNKWDIQFNQVHNKNAYLIRCGAREGRKLFDIIRPYVNQVNCMKYKIDL